MTLEERKIDKFLKDYEIDVFSNSDDELGIDEQKMALDRAKAKASLLQMLAEARVDERNGMQFFNEDGTETHKPYMQYRFTGTGLKLSWEDRTVELTAQLNPKEKES